MQSFTDLGVSETVASAIAAGGIEKPFPIQAKVARPMLDERDVLVRSPTGSGKTLAFGVPLVELLEADDPRPAGLVLAPTRELASQIATAIRGIAHARALSVTAVYGGAGIDKQAKLARKASILVATPGRLQDLVDRGAVELDEVRVLVLDEADRMLDMGFRPAVERLVALTPSDRQTLLLSATLDGVVAQWAREFTRDPVTVEHDHPAEKRGAVEHRFRKVSRDDRYDLLREELDATGGGRTLVFVRTKRGADRLAKRLSRDHEEALAMHGDRSQAQRERALRRFEQGDVRTLVATDVAARGIDVEDVTHVINFDPPAESQDYVHRTGRTARAGRDGIAITFVMDDQRKDVAAMGKALGLEAELDGAGLAASATRPSGGRPQGDGGGRGGANGGQRRSRSRSRSRQRSRAR